MSLLAKQIFLTLRRFGYSQFLKQLKILFDMEISNIKEKPTLIKNMMHSKLMFSHFDQSGWALQKY